jgi:succinate dehydrogenase / fumarate reductase cytochrome b subunit
MAAVERPVVKPRPIYLNLMAIRQPLPAIVSILHRISGALLFAVGIPLLLWFVQTSLASGAGYAAAIGPLSSWFGKLVLLAIAWAYIHHVLAGLRHLALDVHIGTDLAPTRTASAIVMVVALLLTLIVAVRLW